MTTQVDEHVAPGPGWVRLRRGPLLLLPPSSWAGSSCSFACHRCSWRRRRRGRRGRWLCAVKYSSFWQDQWSETCSYRKHSRHGRPGLKTASIIEVSGRYQFIQGQRGGFPFVHLSGLRRRRVSTCSRCSDRCPATGGDVLALFVASSSSSSSGARVQDGAGFDLS